jgi:hypothetical protein
VRLRGLRSRATTPKLLGSAPLVATCGFEHGLTFRERSMTRGTRACVYIACVLLTLLAGAESADVVPGDRAALADLYGATGGSSWTTRTNWNTTALVCTWFGVYCSGTRVTQLYATRPQL